MGTQLPRRARQRHNLEQQCPRSGKQHLGWGEGCGRLRSQSGHSLRWDCMGLGNGTSESSNVPVRVSRLSGVVSVSGGGSHSLALRSDGTVWAWGSNSVGQLGNGTNVDSSVPVRVSRLTAAVAVAAGGAFSLALTGS